MPYVIMSDISGESNLNYEIDNTLLMNNAALWWNTELKFVCMKVTVLYMSAMFPFRDVI